MPFKLKVDSLICSRVMTAANVENVVLRKMRFKVVKFHHTAILLFQVHTICLSLAQKVIAELMQPFYELPEPLLKRPDAVIILLAEFSSCLA